MSAIDRLLLSALVAVLWRRQLVYERALAYEVRKELRLGVEAWTGWANRLLKDLTKALR